MSAELEQDARNPRTGPARAIFETDPDEYPDAVSAIRAALAECPTYECRECGRQRYGNRNRCKECGASAFERVEGGRDR